MSRTVKNQHYIPRSYLKNFGYLVSEYTRPSGQVDKKYSIHNIEKAYDKEVDRHFAKVTEFISDENIKIFR